MRFVRLFFSRRKTDANHFIHAGRAEQLHLAYRALWESQERTGSLPRPNAPEEELKAEIARCECAKIENFDTDVAIKVFRHAALELQPLCAFYGGVS